ncbi:hypothetical protein PF003_g4965, partial [Phytophthora fragariae]
MGCLLTCVHGFVCVYQPSPASSGGSGSSTASPPPAASMGTTASSKLGRHKVSRAVRAACMGCLLIVCMVSFCVSSPAQLAAAAAAAVPRPPP